MMRKYYLLPASTVFLLLAVAPVYAAPSLSLGSTASYSLKGSVKVVQSCTSDPVSYASQACNGIIPPPGPPILGTSFLNDDFAYSSISQMAAAGWVVNSEPSSFYSFGNSLVRFNNNGTAGGGATWTNIPVNLANWSVSTRVAWVGTSGGTTVGDVQVNVYTKGHNYIWEGDGFYGNYGLGREPPSSLCCNGVVTIPGYIRQLNVFHTLRVDMLNNVITATFDGNITAKFIEPDTTVGTTDLTGIGIQGSWNTDDSYDWITAAPLTSATPIPVQPPAPTTVQFDLTGTLGWNVDGLSTSQTNLLVSHNLALSVSPIPLISITPVTESGSFEQSINLASRAESPGTATSILKSALSSYLSTISSATSPSTGFGTMLNTMLSGQSTGPSYTEWWVNGPLSNGTPIQILQGWSGVTGSESLNLGSTVGTRPAWVVTSQLSQSVNVNIPTLGSTLGSSPSSMANMNLNLLWSFDKDSDLLLRNNDTLTLTMHSVTPNPIYVNCGPYCNPIQPINVSVIRDVAITVNLTLLLSSTSLNLSGRGSPTSQTPNQPSPSSSQAPSLMTLAALFWAPIGVAAIAAGLIVGVLVLLRRRAMRTTSPPYNPVTSPSPSPATAS